MTDLTADATRATRQARLIEQVLLDAVQERAAAEHKRADRLAEPAAVIVWTADAGGSVAGRSYRARAGELSLLPASHAQVFVDAGYAQVREPLTLPPGERAEVAAELWQVAGEVQAAALALAPQPAEPQPARQAKANRQGG